MRMKAQGNFRFFVRMASNLEAKIYRATILLGPAVEACVRPVDEYSGPNQQKVLNSLLYSDSLTAFAQMDLLTRLTRRSAGEDSLLRNITTRLLGFTIAVASVCVDTFPTFHFDTSLRRPQL